MIISTDAKKSFWQNSSFFHDKKPLNELGTEGTTLISHQKQFEHLLINLN